MKQALSAAEALVDFHRAELVRQRDAVRRSKLREALPVLPGAMTNYTMTLVRRWIGPPPQYVRAVN